MSAEPPLPPSQARASLTLLTRAADANAFGTVHGGVLLRLADECGALAALKHARGRIVATAALDSFTFLGPVRVGELLEAVAVPTFVGRTSVEAEVELFAAPLRTFRQRRVAVGYALYVALDEAGKPTPVPPLAPETAAEHRRAEAARLRQALRLERRAALAQEQDQEPPDSTHEPPIPRHP